MMTMAVFCNRESMTYYFSSFEASLFTSKLIKKCIPITEMAMTIISME